MSELYGFKKNLEKVQVRSKSESAAKSHLVPTLIDGTPMVCRSGRYDYTNRTIPELANWNVVVLACKCGNIQQNIICFRGANTVNHIVDSLTDTVTRALYYVDWVNNRIRIRWDDGNASLIPSFVQITAVYGLVQNVDVVDQDTEDEPSEDEGEDIDISDLTNEVQGIRIGADGTIYETAGEAVRQQYEKLAEMFDLQDLEEILQTINATVDTAIQQIETAGGLILDPTLTQSGQAADAKVVGEIAKFNTVNFFTDAMKKSGTSHGISYTWDSNKKSCHIVGTSDATSFVNQYANYTALPAGMVTGVDYYLKLSGATNVQCRIYKVVNSQLTLLYAPTSDMVISIPSDAEGLVIRFWCAANTTVDETVELHILNAKTNKDLTDEMDLISTNGDLLVDNLFTIYATSTANSRMHFEQDALNGVYVKILDTQFLRGQIDKNIAWDSISIEKVVSPSGVENCIFIPLNSSLVYDINENIYKIIVTNNNLNSDYIELFTVSRRNGMADIVSGKGLYLYQAWMQYMKGETLPSYWSAYMPAKIAEIQEKDTTIGNHGDSFVFITDVHWNGNAKNSPALIHDVLDNSNVSRVFHGGDICNDDATRLLALTEMRDFLYRFKDVDFTTITGNHDWNDNGKTDSDPTKYLSDDDIYSVMFKFNEKVIDTEGKRYFYKDNITQKIRYIFIDTGHTRALLANDAEQQAWIADILTATESGWKIVIFTHMYWGSLDSNNVPILMGGGTTLNNIIDSVYSEMQAEIIAIVIGHTHYDYAEKSPQGFWRIATGTDDYARSNLAISSTMIKGTTTEQLFDVYHIDTLNKKIYLTRIGAGLDREFEF